MATWLRTEALRDAVRHRRHPVHGSQRGPDVTEEIGEKSPAFKCQAAGAGATKAEGPALSDHGDLRRGDRMQHLSRTANSV